MRKSRLIFLPVLGALLLLGAVPGALYGQQEPLTDRLLSLTKSEPFQVTALVVSTLHFSFEDTDFRGGRTFGVQHARLGVGGVLDAGFHYRFQMEFAREPNLLDAYLGYRFSDRLNVRAGAQKPQISAELLPSPAAIDFLDRARLVGAQLRSREVGLNFFGELSDYHYDLGIYNGTGLAQNVDNRFLVTGRLARGFALGDGAAVTAGTNVAFAECFAAACGLAGLAGDGTRISLGADVRYESERWILAAEVLGTQLEVVHPIIDEEEILGFHLTGGYKTSPNTRVLGRWDRLEFREQGPANNLLLLGFEHQMTRLMAFQLNLVALLDGDADNQVGLSAGWEFVF